MADDKVVKKEAGAVAVKSNVSVDVMMGVLKSTKYLDRLQFMSSGSTQCKAGEFPINHYAFVRGDSLEDIGTDVNVIALAMRLKAMDFNDGVRAVYDPKLNDENIPTGEFKKIMDESEEKDSNMMWGTEFLVYVPVKQEFASLFFGSKTARRDIPSMVARMNKPATLKSKKIETKKYTYYSMLVTPCSETFDLPAQTKVDEEIEKFLNPPESEVEVVDEKDAAATKQAR